MATIRHHRAPRARWGAEVETACGQTARPADGGVVARWSETTCPECLAAHGLTPKPTQPQESPRPTDLVRIGIVLQEAAGEPWPKEKADRVASAAWYVVGKIRSNRK